MLNIKKSALFSLVTVFAFVISACGDEGEATPTPSALILLASATPAEGIGGGGEGDAVGGSALVATDAAAVQPTLDLGPATATPDPSSFPVAISGGEQPTTATNIEMVTEDWLRLVTAENKEGCSWAFTFKMENASGNFSSFLWPHCIEFRAQGTGSFTFTARPDSEYYFQVDTLGTGAAWWVTGNNGQYEVSHDGGVSWNGPYALDAGAAGVAFYKDGGIVSIRVTLNDGYVAIPLGEIRNNSLPQH